MPTTIKTNNAKSIPNSTNDAKITPKSTKNSCISKPSLKKDPNLENITTEAPQQQLLDEYYLSPLDSKLIEEIECHMNTPSGTIYNFSTFLCDDLEIQRIISQYPEKSQKWKELSEKKIKTIYDVLYRATAKNEKIQSPNTSLQMLIDQLKGLKDSENSGANIKIEVEIDDKLSKLLEAE